jgi:hypothetical protein
LNVEEVAQQLRSAPPLHARVHGVLLPLSVRQNRVEDIFLDFLTWLVPTPAGGRSGQVRSADATSDFILERMGGHPDRFRLPEDARKQQLIRRWIRADLVVDPRQTNRTTEDAVSIVPLHAAVANYFDPPGQPPAYGRFACELLARVDGDLELTLLERLAAYLGDAGTDPVARLLEGALGDGHGPAGEPQFRTLAARDDQRLVWSSAHARGFREQIDSALAYRRSVSRRTFVAWLYSLVTFFLSTYFLRTATVAEAYARWLEGVFGGDRTPWTRTVDDDAFAPRIPYACRDESHARILKRFPGYTSQVVIAERFAELVASAKPSQGDLGAAGVAVVGAVTRIDAEEVFRLVAREYPTQPPDRRGPWKLPSEDKARLLKLAASVGTHPFVVATRVLNFEDMARRSNNVMEWQFYSSLAKHPSYGFAGRGRTGDVLAYRMSEPLLVAFAHCHIEQSGGVGTFGSLLEYLSTLGFLFDADGRLALENQLIEVGMLEDLSDASDAKYLTPLYVPEEAGT